MTQRFVALDGIRGIAALAVVCFHLAPTWPGYLAVDLFFVLSGFILAHVYFFAPEQVSFRTFTVQRIARLYPLHIFTLVTFCGAFFLTRGYMPTYNDSSVFLLFQHFTLLNNVGLSPGELSFNYVSWSISVEFWLNLALFALVPLILTTPRLLLIVALSFGVLIAAIPHLDAPNKNIAGMLNSGLLRGAGAMALGILSYKLFCLAQTRLQNARTFLGLAEIAVVALTIVIVVARPEKQALTDYCAPFLFALLVPIFAMEKGLLSDMFGKLAWLGDISYSVYLNHVTVLILARAFMGDLDVFTFIGVYIGAVLIYSRLTFLYIERPARSAIRRLAERPAPLQATT